MNPPADAKTCTRCERDLPLSEFAVDRKAADRHQSQCRECKLESSRLWLQDDENRERQRTYSRQSMARLRLRRQEREAALLQKIETTPPRTEGPGLYPEPRPLATDFVYGNRIGLVPEGTDLPDLPAEFLAAIESDSSAVGATLLGLYGIDLMPVQIALESMSHDGLVEVAWWAAGLPARREVTR